MYYHARPLKYVKYDKVYPCPVDILEERDEKIDIPFFKMYKWLGFYCKFYPQIWLARSTSQITGIRKNEDKILFGFDIIKGFPLVYDEWEFLMNYLIDVKTDNVTEINKYIVKEINDLIHEVKRDGDYKDLDENDTLKKWEKCANIEEYLTKYVFIEKDQIVVPSLNLKAAKEIICRNEKQKKKLRQMGFIEDRIKIKNIKPSRW